MSYAVQKDPIKVIEIKGSDNINNYSELTYRKLETVPVGVPDKYLKWELDVLVEMTTAEKAIVDGADLLSVKQAKWREIEAKANAEIDTVIGGENGKGYVLGEIFLRTMTDSTENLLTPEQILQLKQTIELVVAKTRQKYALIMAPDVTAEELSTVVW